MTSVISKELGIYNISDKDGQPLYFSVGSPYRRRRQQHTPDIDNPLQIAAERIHPHLQNLDQSVFTPQRLAESMLRDRSYVLAYPTGTPTRPHAFGFVRRLPFNLVAGLDTAANGYVFYQLGVTEGVDLRNNGTWNSQTYKRAVGIIVANQIADKNDNCNIYLPKYDNDSRNGYLFEEFGFQALPEGGDDLDNTLGVRQILWSSVGQLAAKFSQPEYSYTRPLPQPHG